MVVHDGCPPRAPRRHVDDDDRPCRHRRRSALLAAIPWRIARLGGGLGALGDGDLLAESLRGPIGVSTAVTAVGLLVMAALVGAAPAALVADVGGGGGRAVALAGFSIEGHTRSRDPIAAMIGLDIVHLSAGAMWLGGLAGLVVSFRSGTEAAMLARQVVRFRRDRRGHGGSRSRGRSRHGPHRAAVLDDLVTTGYGLALLTKVALVVPVIGMGAYNRRRLVPIIRGGCARHPWGV